MKSGLDAETEAWGVGLELSIICGLLLGVEIGPRVGAGGVHRSRASALWQGDGP